jgi:uncharacterized protein (TIGR02996 family)
MTDATTLLQAIIADPDNDAPRLAYADWLDAEGDAERAMFIRVQCALEYLPTDDPQYAPLRQRETELLGQYGYRWAEEFGDQISVWVYRRGFIERIEMRLETSAEQIRTVLGHAPIRHIRDLSQLDNLTGVVEALPNLARLTGLEFWGLYAFDDHLLARILNAPELANLHTLILHHDRNGNLAKESVLVEAIGQSAALAGLAELDLGGCSLTESTWRAVLNLPQLRQLRWLRLHGARLVDRERRHRGELHDLTEYADAFTARVAVVDWDTAFIDPYSGGAWTGLSWEARRRNKLFAMNRFIRTQEYDQLEAEYRRECLLNGGHTITDAIEALPFTENQRQLAIDLAPRSPNSTVLLRKRSFCVSGRI